VKSALICARDLRRSFERGKVQALRGISLTVYQGEFVAIQGPSGSGKSTLLNILGSLDTDFEGDVSVGGVDLRRLADPARFRARVVGFIFQSFHLLPTLTALENVQVPMFEMSWPARRRQERALHLLESVGLADRIQHIPSQLSGGERQRVAIARSLANEPSLLLADEPTGNLDSTTARDILEVLQNVYKSGRVTIITITHDELVASCAERTLQMLDGRILGASSQELPN
jgi:ABC-type lipoprotein export system ATPase subunit